MNTDHNNTQSTHLKDYQASTHLIPKVALTFELDSNETIVTNRMEIVAQVGQEHQALVLDADQLEFISVYVDGVALSEDEYTVSAKELCIKRLPPSCIVEIKNKISPANNKELMGLYASSGNMCTQCEAEGFRRITYALDRPDVLSVFTTTIIADQKSYPTLLSNGNLISEEILDNGKHKAVWHDPFPKPSYLFALVAGRFDLLEDRFTTMSGREVALKIFTDVGQGDQCHHALEAVKKSMHWDEINYGREYDLDLFMIVAVNDFNFGAMENKGLNIFNARYILAKDETATDSDFSGVETVVAHEYFHNWSGNRVTVRDWFQLSLKEGLTVYRDQSFDEDNISKVVHRINTVTRLRGHQFKEDQGPMAHPVQPKSYLKIDNFYTLTIYAKGAEIIRMFHLLLGDEGYRSACDEYFETFDGQAVTIHDFARTMQNHTDIDLEPFFEWYHQAGTPVVKLHGAYDAEAQSYTLTARQHTPDTPGQSDKKPMLIPINMGLISADGQDLDLPELYRGELFLLSEREQSITFNNIKQPVTPSLFRHFSAPVRVEFEYSDDQLKQLLRYETDGFNRWQAGQYLALRELDRLIEAANAQQTNLGALVSQDYLEVIESVFDEDIDDLYYHSLLLAIPSESYLMGRIDAVNPEAVVKARQALKHSVAQHLSQKLKKRFEQLKAQGEANYDVKQMGRRAMLGLCLAYLTSLKEDAQAFSEVQALAQDLLVSSMGINMTDTVTGLSALNELGSDLAQTALQRFHDRFVDTPLVINKWLDIQASTPSDQALAVMNRLIGHPSFSIENPNNVYSSILAFASKNTLAFHAEDGSGYRFLADQVLRLDRINPMVAARVVNPLTHWRRFEPNRSALMKAELERLLVGHSDGTKLSDNVKEYLIKSLE